MPSCWAIWRAVWRRAVVRGSAAARREAASSAGEGSGVAGENGGAGREGGGEVEGGGRRALVEGGFGGEDEAFLVAEGVGVFPEDVEGGVGDTGEDFEGGGEVGLVEVGVDEGANVEVSCGLVHCGIVGG